MIYSGDASDEFERLRRDRTLAAKSRLLEVPEAMEDEPGDTAFPDERLELVFTCRLPTSCPTAWRPCRRSST